jgi:hypothetical protein
VSKSGVIGLPRGRPFAKGQSGNPGGRPIKPKTIEQRKLEHDVRMFARERGAEAIDKLVAIMRGVVRVEIDRKPVEMLVPPMAQLAAANALLDRGYGRPHQSVEMTGKVGDPIEHHEVSALEVIERGSGLARTRRHQGGQSNHDQPVIRTTHRARHDFPRRSRAR